MRRRVRTEIDGLRTTIAKLEGDLKPLNLTLPAKRVAATKAANSGIAITLTGPAGRAVKTRLTIGQLRAKALGLRSTTLATGSATLGTDGRGRVTLKPKGASAKALRELKRSLAITVAATSGDRAATAKGT